MTFVRNRHYCWAMALVLGCQSAPASKQNVNPEPGAGGDSGASNSTTDESGGADPTDTTPSGTGATATNQGGQNSVGGTAGTSVAVTGGAATISTQLTVTKASARIGGRRGDDLYVTVEGSGTVGVLGSVGIELLDGAGNAIVAFDKDWDGVNETSAGRIVPQKFPTTGSFTAEAVLSGVKSLKTPQKLNVRLFDRDNNVTKPVTIAVQQQAVLDLGGACDPKAVTSRCREGYSCSGTPSMCVEGTPPTMTHAMYQRNAEGPYIRVDGVDPDEDVILVRVDFLTAADVPIMVDMDGDETVDADHFEVEAGLSNQSGGYTFVVQSGLGFDTIVPRLGLTAIDSKLHESPTQRVNISNQTTRSSGQSCDLTGFVGCIAGTSCLPNAQGSAAYCTTATQAQTSRCTAAATWNIGKDPQKITGTIAGFSAWQPPSSCISATVANRPEAVVKMHVAKALTSLTLTTAEPETQVDTGLYVLTSCTATSDTALDCNDDTLGYASTVTLTNVAAGDYFVIVESNSADSGSFGLSATFVE